MAEIDWSALQTPDFGGNALKANVLGRQEGLSLAKQNALRQYTTDPDGGIRALMAVDPATAVTLQKAQAEQRDHDSSVQAGQLAAKGDYSGAASAAGAAGNFDLMDKIQQMSKAQRDQLSSAYSDLAATALGVKKLPYEERKAAIAQQAPRLQALGLTPEQINSFDPTDQGIDGFVNASLGVKGQIDRAREDKNAAKPSYTTLKDGPVERMVQTNPIADGADYTEGQGWRGGSPAPAQTEAAAAPPQALAGGQAPVGLRNNNPLNLRPLGPGQGQWNGQTGTDSGFAVFATPQDGWNAAHKNLAAYATQHGINTIQGVAARWAPQGDGANDPAAYAQTVASSLGIKPDTPLDFRDPQVRERVLSAMAQVETGQSGPPQASPAPQGGPAGQSPPQGAPQPPVAASGPQGVAPGAWQPRTVMTGAAEPKIHEVTGPDGTVHTYDISDPQHPKELPISGVAKSEWQVLTDPKTGSQYRYNPSTGKATTLDGSAGYTPQGAQKIASGTFRSPAVMATQKFIEDFPAQHNGQQPTADDLVKFNATLGERVKAAKDFGSGALGSTVRSFNVGISHLDTLQRLSDALQNGDAQVINAVKQEVAQQTGKPAPNSFNAAKQIVADEIIKAVTGGGGGVGDRDKAQAAVSRANSPAQLRDVIATYKDLMAGQLSGLKRQYINASGFDDFEDKLDPSTRAALETHAGGSAASAPAAGNRPPLSSFKR